MYEKTTTVISDSSGSRFSFSGGDSVQPWVRLATAGSAGGSGYCASDGLRACASGDYGAGVRTSSGGGCATGLRAARGRRAPAGDRKTSRL